MSSILRTALTPEQRAEAARWDELPDPRIANYPGRRRFKTGGEARAAERGYQDFPRFIEVGVAAYSAGWHDAEAAADAKHEARAEAQAEKWEA